MQKKKNWSHYAETSEYISEEMKWGWLNMRKEILNRGFPTEMGVSMSLTVIPNSFGGGGGGK